MDDETPHFFDGSTHDTGTYALEWSGASNVIATGCKDGSVGLWRDQRSVAVAHGHDGWVRAVAWSPDGQLLATSGMDARVVLWSCEGRKIASADMHKIDALAADAGQRDESSSSSRSLSPSLVPRRVRDPDLGSCRGCAASVLCVLRRPRSRAFGARTRRPDATAGFYVLALEWLAGNILAIGGSQHVVSVWEVDVGCSGRPLRLLRAMRDHSDSVRCLACSPCGGQLASGSDDKSVRIWEHSENVESAVFMAGFSAVVQAVAWSPCGSMLVACSSDSSLRVVHASVGPDQGVVAWTWRGEQCGVTAGINCVRFSPNGQLIAACTHMAIFTFTGVQRGRRIGSSVVKIDAPRVRYDIAFSPCSQSIVYTVSINSIRHRSVLSAAALLVPSLSYRRKSSTKLPKIVSGRKLAAFPAAPPSPSRSKIPLPLDRLPLCWLEIPGAVLF